MLYYTIKEVLLECAVKKKRLIKVMKHFQTINCGTNSFKMKSCTRKRDYNAPSFICVISSSRSNADSPNHSVVSFSLCTPSDCFFPSMHVVLSTTTITSIAIFLTFSLFFNCMLETYSTINFGTGKLFHYCTKFQTFFLYRKWKDISIN